MKKRMLAVLLGVVLVLSSVCAVYAAPAAATEPYEQTIVSGEGDDQVTYTFKGMASNDRFVLAIDEASTYISLTDKTTGQTWYSNPPIAVSTDPYLEGMAKTDIRSILHVSYTNASLKVKETNSYSGSVMKEAFEIKEVKDGIRVDYNFEEVKITIPVQYTLTEDGMKAEILYSEMKQDSTNVINTIDFLTYFGAAGEKDEGYMIVPDGSGAVINFNNDKNVDSMMYKKPFYGADQAITTNADVVSSRSETITLPVYGMVKNGYGFLAEVVSGAETAFLEAATSGNRLIGAYNVIYTSADHRITYELPLMGQISSETSNARYNAEDAVSLDSYAVQFHFSENNQSSYATLASKYREILTERGWLKKGEITNKFYAELYGAVSKKKSFVGILYNARETLTSFEQAQAILQDLQDGGVSEIGVQYVNFSDDFFNNDIEIKLNPSGSLGGKKGMNSLLTFASEKKIDIASAADFFTIKSGGNGYNMFWDVADAINISPIEVFPVSLNGNTFDTSKRPYKLIDPTKYENGITSLKEAMNKYGYTSFYFDDEAVQLYSDLTPGGLQAERTSAEQAKQFAALAEAGAKITMSNPNAYLFAVADELVNIPVCSSKEILFDGDIPFLQIVLRGVMNFGGESMNITDVSDEAFLRHLEYGTNIRYALINATSEALLNTDHTFLYSATYDNFKDQIKERYQVIKAYGEAVGDATITAHSRENGVATTTYSNGVKVIINYNDAAVTVNGTTVDGMSYAIV